MTYKGNNSFRTTLSAIVCTLVVSTICLASVVGPAATAYAATPSVYASA